MTVRALVAARTARRRCTWRQWQIRRPRLRHLAVRSNLSWAHLSGPEETTATTP